MNYSKKAFFVCVLGLSIVMSKSALGDAEQSRLGVGGGTLEALDSMDNWYGQVTYEFAEIEALWGIRPTLLTMQTEEPEHYVSAGWLKEFDINDKWGWGIGNAVGFHSDDDQLGHHIEFYSRIFVNRNLNQDAFLRLEFGHLSNAGLGERNPGTENIGLSYSYRF